MSEKVYGFSGTNKCRKEVVSKEEYTKKVGQLDNDVSKLIPQNWISIMTVHQQGFSAINNMPRVYSFTENNLFGDSEQSYTVECMIHDFKNGTFVPVPVVNTTAEVQSSEVACAFYSITEDEVQVQLFVGISLAAYNLLKADSNKSLMGICRRYA